eukprot:893519-Alexandrium_andersonii.AAC.1
MRWQGGGSDCLAPQVAYVGSIEQVYLCKRCLQYAWRKMKDSPWRESSAITIACAVPEAMIR